MGFAKLGEEPKGIIPCGTHALSFEAFALGKIESQALQQGNVLWDTSTLLEALLSRLVRSRKVSVAKD